MCARREEKIQRTISHFIARLAVGEGVIGGRERGWKLLREVIGGEDSRLGP